MLFRDRRGLVLLVALLGHCIALFSQAAPGSAYAEKREKASQLFQQGKRLEALPLLEELAQANPKDDLVLVALAASLVDHAATLTDQDAAGKERLRARELVEKALDLGNTSALAQNLAQLLRQLPASGAIEFSGNPAVEQAMRAGEAAFSKRDFDEALKNYGKALELEPKNYSAALFTANTYDRKNDVAGAAQWYQRAIQIDPNIETAYRYYADMLAKQGEMGRSRVMLIQAAVAEPYNRIVWRELHAWATLNNTKINQLYIGIPVPPKEGAASHPGEPLDASPAWQAYREVRSRWQAPGYFKKRFPDEQQYRHSLPEEFEALTAAAKVLDKIRQDKTSSPGAINDPDLSLLMKLYEAGLIEPYVLFSLGDAGIAKDYPDYRAHSRDKLEKYLEQFVVPPVPAAGK